MGQQNRSRNGLISYGTFDSEEIRQVLALRAGYYTQNKLKGDIHYVSIGAGLKLKGFGLEAAYLFPNQRNEVLKNTFRISLSKSFQ